jgi:hypothetical protein
MITTLNTSCSENTMVCQQGEGFCMHVFSSLNSGAKSLRLYITQYKDQGYSLFPLGFTQRRMSLLLQNNDMLYYDFHDIYI